MRDSHFLHVAQGDDQSGDGLMRDKDDDKQSVTFHVDYSSTLLYKLGWIGAEKVREWS